MQSNGQTDMTKLIVTPRYFAKTPDMTAHQYIRCYNRRDTVLILSLLIILLEIIGTLAVG